MSRMVVTTRDGAPLYDLEVEGDENVAHQVAAWVQALPGLPIYINGNLLPDDMRQQILLALAQDAPAVPPQPNDNSQPKRSSSLTSAEFATFNQLLGQAADDVRRAHFQVIEQAQAFASWQLGYLTQASEMMLERDKQAADEAARQRKMTHQSLKDIDLLDRSVKVTELTEVFQGISARGASSANVRMMGPGRAPIDWMHALATLVGGYKQSDQKTDESK